MLNVRQFDIIAFITRRGRLFRMACDHYEFDNAENIPGQIMRRTAAQCAMGRNVLVLEFGCIKADWSRITDAGLHALMTCDKNDYLRFVRHIVNLRDNSRENFLGHVERSFSEKITPRMRVKTYLDSTPIRRA